MKNKLFFLLSIFTFNLCIGQNCLDSLSDKSVIILKNNKKLQKFSTVKNNRTEFYLIQRKDKKINTDYINSFKEKSICIWNENKFKRNKRAIIATSIIGGMYTISSLALIPNKKYRESTTASNVGSQFGQILSSIIMAPYAGIFDITAIGLGIKRAVIMKKSKKNKINYNF